MTHMAVEEKPKSDEFKTLDFAHYSLQFSDPEKQQFLDVKKMFAQDYDAITGTEAGVEDLRRILRVAAHKADYALHMTLSNWVAVKRELILPNTFRKGGEVFVDSDETVGKGHDLHVAWVQWEMKRIGKIALMASHYATNGRPDARGRESRVNLDENKRVAHGVGDLAQKLGRGDALAFYGGDQNIVDRDNDTFFGEDLTSGWDELKKYEDTGHGNIDVIASYDKDGRVEAKYIRALDDSEQFMFGDHFPVEAGFRVKLLAA